MSDEKEPRGRRPGRGPKQRPGRRDTADRGSSSRNAPARVVAARVLLRVESDGAWADRALAVALERNLMDARDAAFATELVYGTLRQTRWLDAILRTWAQRPLSKLPKPVLVALRLGAYDLLFGKSPAYSIVNDVVALVKGGYPHLAGMTNAMLRRLTSARDEQRLPDPAAELSDPIDALALRTAHPTWLVQRVAELRGADAAAAWAAANNDTPPVVLRVNPLRSTPEAALAALVGAGVDAALVPHVPGAITVRSGGRVAALPGFAEGALTVQDLGAQLVGRMAVPARGSVVLDACAAPGGKSTHLAEQMHDEGKVLAVDVHRAKTRLIAENARRLGLSCVVPLSADAADPSALDDIMHEQGLRQVDLVLLDAPCSGFGTLRRHPELRRRTPEEVTGMRAMQDRLLRSVLRFLRPGGALVYAVCTVLPEEGPERIAALLAEHPELSRDRPSDPVLQPFLDADGALHTWPDVHPEGAPGPDGFFAARLRLRE